MSKFQICKFCKEPVNLDDEGATYRDGTCAHDHCHDNNEFEAANQADMQDQANEQNNRYQQFA